MVVCQATLSLVLCFSHQDEGLGSSYHSHSSVCLPEPWGGAAAAGEAVAGRLLEYEDQLGLHSGSCSHLWPASHVVLCHLKGSSLRLVS